MEEINAYKILVYKPQEKGPLKYLGVNGRIILKQILGKWDLRVWTECTWLRTDTDHGV
jgi:hypothetical protein